MTLLYILDWLIYILFLVNIVYLLVFAVASGRTKGKVYYSNNVDNMHYSEEKRFAILIPAYKEDSVIIESAQSAMTQDYGKANFDVVVISDRMSDATNDTLTEMGVKLVKVYFENSTKAKALNLAMNQIGDNYDLALVLDADNIIPVDFISRLNRLFSDTNVKIVQAHRCAKNTNNQLALLDAVSEEINNSIFRKGHVNLGLSSALIGSGMCFDYKLFKDTMLSIDAVGGFDRALELDFLYKGIKIDYFADLDLLDEKVQHQKDFSRQRLRWLSAQIHYLGRSVPKIPAALISGNFDFCDKVFQQMSIPRVMLLGFTTIFAFALLFIDSFLAAKWLFALLLLIVALVLAIPRYMMKKELLISIFKLPYYFALMTLNIFKLKGANKKFIHTNHGVK